MRTLLQHLPLLLTLLIPLGLLAWLGSQELSRLEHRARSILQEEAHRFLNTEETKVRNDIEILANRWLWQKPQVVSEQLARSDQTISEVSQTLAQESSILEVFVADQTFALIAPQVRAGKGPAAPLHRFPIEHDSEHHDLALADLLTNMGDTDGAIEALESYIRDRESFSSSEATGEIWANFRLGGLYDKVGSGLKAADSYFFAQTMAEQAWVQQPNEDNATVQLFSKILRAEVLLDPKQLLEIFEGICAGSYEFRFTDDLTDDLLDWTVYQYLIKFFPRQSEHRASVDRALELYRVRKLGRRFARDYESHAQRALRIGHSKNDPSSHPIVYHTLTTERSTSLLALRPATLAVRNRYEGAEWIGLRLDLPALISRSLSGNPTSVPGNIALAVHDPSGVPLLVSGETPPSEKPAMEFAPIESELASLKFIAIPLTDPAELQNAERAQLILGLILVIVAAGGAFMLVRSARQQTELAKMKVQLLSRVTHELKTPLAVIKMYGETLGLGRAKDEDQLRKFAGIISTESDRLTNMVSRILDFSKMEAGTFSYEKRQIDLGEIVESVRDEYTAHIEAKGKVLVGTIRHGLLARVDPEALAGSVVNLLENAVKYTPDTAPSQNLELDLQRQNGHAVLEVRDRGTGIPTEELGRVFDDFYRASNAGETRGAGLGLSLVDHFARSHGGKIEALVREGGGTTIRLTLPLTEADSKEPSNSTS
ncbi:MAG: HAMP domain-containing sensor histidine kinase [Planctomycetota bacterium]|nr:HAMP domain-containing sensor histidine kinase [Planctomycetota bacterium]